MLRKVLSVLLICLVYSMFGTAVTFHRQHRCQLRRRGMTGKGASREGRLLIFLIIPQQQTVHGPQKFICHRDTRPVKGIAFCTYCME